MEKGVADMFKGILVFACLILLSGVAQADIAADAASDDYMVKAPAMLLRGTTSILEVPGDMLGTTYHHNREGRPVIGLMEGLLRSTTGAIDKGTRGIFDVAFSFVPRFHGLA